MKIEISDPKDVDYSISWRQNSANLCIWEFIILTHYLIRLDSQISCLRQDVCRIPAFILPESIIILLLLHNFSNAGC